MVNKGLEGANRGEALHYCLKGNLTRVIWAEPGLVRRAYHDTCCTWDNMGNTSQRVGLAVLTSLVFIVCRLETSLVCIVFTIFSQAHRRSL
jgi:hypothetical protein